MLTRGVVQRISAAIFSSGTFANKPSSPRTGQQYFASDVGSGVLLVYDGTKWKPIGGSVVLYNDTAAHTAVTAVTTEVNYAAYKINGGLLSASGSLRVFAEGKYTGTAGTKTGILRHNTTSGAVTGGTLIYSNVNGGSASSLSGSFYKMIHNTSTSAQIIQPTNSNQAGGTAGTAGVATGAIDTTADSYLNFNVTNSVSGDTVGYQGILIEWIEQ